MATQADDIVSLRREVEKWKSWVVKTRELMWYGCAACVVMALACTVTVIVAVKRILGERARE